MKVRTKLTLAFAYILLTVIVALEVPLAINLRKRALAELETRQLVQAQAIAANIGREGLKKAQALVQALPNTDPSVRVIVVDSAGVMIADSAGSGLLGQLYVTPDRPELEKVSQPPYEPVTLVRHSSELGQDILATAAPIIDENAQNQTDYLGAVRLTESMAQVTANVQRAVYGLVAIGFAGLAAGVLIAYALAASIARPLGRLASTARRLGDGDLTARAGVLHGTREMEELSGSFDEMAERLEGAMRAQREFVANASHQLRTPLTAMKLRLESAVDEAPTEEVRRQLEAADREVDRLSRIVTNLLETSKRMETGEQTETVDVDRAVKRAVSRWEARARQKESSLLVRGRAGLAAADETDLDQILDNLIDNAITHAPGAVTITTGTAGGRVLVAVEDRGPGIRREEVGLVTERFFRGGGAPAGGSGLGLAIVKELAGRWGGSVEVSSERGLGTKIEVRLSPAGERRRGDRVNGAEEAPGAGKSSET